MTSLEAAAEAVQDAQVAWADFDIMIRPLGDVIILMPPLSIADNELTSLVDIVHESIVEVTGN